MSLDPLRSLIIGGVEVPYDSAHEMEQTYEDIERSTIFPMGSGNNRKRVFAAAEYKLKTVITGKGTIPVGLNGVSFVGPVVISCARHRAITSQSNIINLPPGRRSDAGSEPYGRAQVGGRGGAWADTPLTLNGDEATLTVVDGASSYQAVYFPEILAVVKGRGAKEVRGKKNRSAWSLEAIEE